jgi:hypothetical protein
MQRPTSADRQREADELLRYLEVFAARVWQQPSRAPTLREIHAAIVAESGEAKALQGLRQAANDTIDMYRHESKEALDILDAALREQNALTFTAVRARYDRAYKRLLKRGRILNDTEYYMVAGVLSDSTVQVSEHERAALARLSAAYPGDA